MNSTPTRVFNFDLPYTLFFSLLGISEILKPFKQNLIKMSNSMSNFLAVILASKKLFFFTILKLYKNSFCFFLKIKLNSNIRKLFPVN